MAFHGSGVALQEAVYRRAAGGSLLGQIDAIQRALNREKRPRRDTSVWRKLGYL